MDEKTELIEKLNHKNKDIRLRSLKELAIIAETKARENIKKDIKEDKKDGKDLDVDMKTDIPAMEIDISTMEMGRPTQDVNNHIHTTYSFSPYSPTKAIWMAYKAGLATAGIMDHDSVSGAQEFIEAGKILGIKTTVGVECRADFSQTLLKGKRINNPDQKTIAYMALHGIAGTKINEVQDYFSPYIKERNKRNRLMVEKVNVLFKPFNIAVDYEKDVESISKINEGGSITERHILFALSDKLIERFGKGKNLVNFLKEKFRISVKPTLENYLTDRNNIFYEYDLLGLLKSSLIEQIYINATDECPKVNKLIDFSNNIGAISTYAYLGDVVDSVTGDKKAQKFEDDYIELLFQVLKDLGFNAITYMPSRNTREQLRKIKSLCREYGLFQISGEDINSPRQSFICEAMRDKEFQNLTDSTWALIGHEKMVGIDTNKAMFSEETVKKYPKLDERVQIYKNIGMKNTENSALTKVILKMNNIK